MMQNRFNYKNQTRPTSSLNITATQASASGRNAKESIRSLF